MYGGRGGGDTAHAFLISALDGGEWSASRPGEGTPGTYLIKYNKSCEPYNDMESRRI
jgi:hypothetical protein